MLLVTMTSVVSVERTSNNIIIVYIGLGDRPILLHGERMSEICEGIFESVFNKFPRESFYLFIKLELWMSLRVLVLGSNLHTIFLAKNFVL